MRISDWSSDVCSSDLLAAYPERLLTIDVRPSFLLKFEDSYALSPAPGGTKLNHSFSCRGLFVGLRLPGVRKSFETMLDAIDGILASHLEKKYRGLPPSKPKPKHRGRQLGRASCRERVCK